MDKIWVIEYNYYNDGYDRPSWDTEIDPDYGFFTSLEDAEAKCEALSQDKFEYERMVATRTATNERILASHEYKARQNKALVDAGLEPAHKIGKEPRLEKILTLDEYLKQRTSYYAPLEIERGTLE